MVLGLGGEAAAVGLASLAAASACLWLALRERTMPWISIRHAKASTVCKRIVAAMPSLHGKDHPMTPWLRFNGHFSTVFCALFRTIPHVAFVRETFTFVDGGTAFLDWYSPPGAGPAHRTVILLPGLTGSSSGTYIRHMAQALEGADFRCVTFNARGCGGAPLTSPRTISAAGSSDLREVVAHLQQEIPGAALYAVGSSLGSIVLVKYLAEEGEDVPLRGAMSISNPWDLLLASDALESFPAKHLYNATLTRTLKSMVKENEAVLQQAVECDRVYDSRTIREFDINFICQLFGYEHVNDYYHDATSCRHAFETRVPLLALNAADDPFAPSQGIPDDLHEENSNVIIVVVEGGGHLAFPKGLLPLWRNWHDDVMVEFLTACDDANTSSQQQES